MDKDEIITQRRDSLDQSNCENELLKKRVRELEALLAKYENPHTPPSLKRGGNRKKSQNEKDAIKGKPSRKKGHKGVTRPPANPGQIAAAHPAAELRGIR